MCGIIFLYGQNAATRLPEALHRLEHRGPDARGTWVADRMALGFTRLAINGEGSLGRQPHCHGEFVGAINGEIYNYRELACTYGFKPSECDTHIILPLFALHGSQVIHELDGFYSGVAFRPSAGEVWCLRDHIGKKPLFVGRSRDELFITSELKALDEIEWFELLPRGTSQVDLRTGRVTQIEEHRPIPPRTGIVPLLEDAVRKRIPHSKQPVGIFLSGGLDSSLVAAIASRLREDATYFTLGDGPDRRAVDTVASALRLKDLRIVALPSTASFPELLSKVVYATESYNPSIVSNGLATFLLAKAAHEAGIKVVLTGEGADELFGGYHLFREDEPWQEIRNRLIHDMHFTELRRLDMGCMAHSVEARCPFLDRAVRGFSDNLSFGEIYKGEQNKVTLRRQFEGYLPQEVLERRKTSFDVGSGIRHEVVRYLRRNGRNERDELRRIWRKRFAFDSSRPFFHAYPIFDEVIDRREGAHR